MIRELIILDLNYRGKAEERPNPEEYKQAFPNDETAIDEAFESYNQETQQEATVEISKNRDVPAYDAITCEEGAIRLKCPHCSSHIVLVDRTLAEITCDNCGGSFNIDQPSSRSGTAELPQSIDRFQVLELLGRGAFGSVYKAHDDQLDRDVAVKVPHSDLLSCPQDAIAYFNEARTVANLDHPNIVPVYDVGQTDEFPCYVVSKYIEGMDLSDRIKHQRLNYQEVVELIATVAEALHYAHKQGFVHRDIKPGNILLGNDGKAYVVDFGLALKEQDIGKGSGYAGTPAYMSPEQARGEGHRVEGRSDIYGLGAVFYELLVGRRTFSADTIEEMLKQITSQEVKPPRQIDDSVPKELERICLKSLAKRASDRYTTALDVADDLRLVDRTHGRQAFVLPFENGEHFVRNYDVVLCH